MEYTTISTAGMNFESWMYERKKGLTGTDIPAIFGFDKYKSAMDVYLDKTTDYISTSENEATWLGKTLEDSLAVRFQQQTSMKVRRTNKIYVSKKYPWMRANPDRILVSNGLERAGLEIKTASPYLASEWENGSTPLRYVLQACHYMICLGFRQYYIACEILQKEFVIRKIEWDDELMEMLISEEEKFWNLVQKRQMPPADGSKAFGQAIKARYDHAVAGKVIKLEGFDERLKEWENISGMIADLDTRKRQIEQEIQMEMGDNEKGLTDNYRINWSNVKSVRIDTTGLKSAYPEICKDFTKEVATRRFQIKAA